MKLEQETEYCGELLEATAMADDTVVLRVRLEQDVFRSMRVTPEDAQRLLGQYRLGCLIDVKEWYEVTARDERADEGTEG